MHNHQEDTGVPFLQILVPALSVCFVFTITIGMFPAVAAEVKSSIAGTSAWGEDTRGSQDGGRQGLEEDWEWARRGAWAAVFPAKFSWSICPSLGWKHLHFTAGETEPR